MFWLTLDSAVTFPLSTMLFTLPWPLLGALSLNRFVVVGLAIELSGIVYYQHASSKLIRSVDSSQNTEGSIEGTYLLAEEQNMSLYDATPKPDPSAPSTG